MLKLEKNSRNHDVSVSFRSRDSRFNRTFLTAFGIALALHVIAGTLFQIRPFLLGSSEVILPPVAASADLTDPAEENENIAIASVDKNDHLPRLITEPRYSKPAAPDIAAASINRHMEYVMKKETSANANPFAAIEQDLHSPDLDYIEGILQFTPVTVRVSGQLADKSIEGKSIDDELVDMTKPVPCHATSVNHVSTLYDVRVEDRTGRIFWFEPKQPVEDPAHKQAAENILQRLRFQTDNRTFVTSGEIEIVFTIPDAT